VPSVRQGASDVRPRREAGVPSSRHLSVPHFPARPASRGSNAPSTVFSECDVLGSSRLLYTSWDETWHLMARAVARRQTAKMASVPALLGVKSAGRGQDYITVVSDLERGTVEYISVRSKCPVTSRKKAERPPLVTLKSMVLSAPAEPRETLDGLAVDPGSTHLKPENSHSTDTYWRFKPSGTLAGGGQAPLPASSRRD
jgi:hypothetical protein